MMKRQLNYAIWISCLLIMVGCSKQSPSALSTPPVQTQSVRGLKEQTETSTIQLKPNVIYTRQDITSQIVSKADDRIVFNSARSVADIKKGDILYSSGLEGNQPAFAKKVSSITHANGQVICKVEQAMMDEVFDTLDQSNKLRISTSGIVTYDIESQLKGDALPSHARALYMQPPFMRGLSTNSHNNRVSYEFGSDGLTLSMIAWDKDGNYKTKDDQLNINLKLDTKDFDSHFGFKGGTLSAEGQWKSKIIAEIIYGGYSLLNEEARKAQALEALRGGKDADPSWDGARKALKALQKRRIKLASVPILAVGNTMGRLKAGLTLDLYLLFECDLRGNLSVSMEYSPITLDYNIKLGRQNDYKVSICDPEKPSLRNINVTGKIETTGKLGFGVGFVFNFPAFPNPKTVNSATQEDSYIGIFADLYLGLNAGMDSKFTSQLNSSTDATGHIHAHMDMSLSAQSYFETRLFFSFIKDWKVDIKYDFFKKPYQIGGLIEADFGWIFMQSGDKYAISQKLWHNDNKISVIESGDAASTVKYDDRKFTFTGVKEGKSLFTMTFPQQTQKYGYFWVYVYPRSGSNNINDIDPSKGEAL